MNVMLRTVDKAADPPRQAEHDLRDAGAASPTT